MLQVAMGDSWTLDVKAVSTVVLCVVFKRPAGLGLVAH
jgi:hypothetical protein